MENNQQDVAEQQKNQTKYQHKKFHQKQQKCKKTSGETILFGIKMITDDNQFGDGWYKCIMDLFVGQRIVGRVGS